MKSRHHVLLVALVLAGLVLVSAATEEEEITPLYRRAVAGDKAAVEQCIAKLAAAVAQHPENQLAQVYLGSAHTLRSRDLPYGPAKLSTLRRGLAEMDAAVAAAPENVRVRLVRALTTDSLPFFFGRKTQTRADFSWLVEKARTKGATFREGDLQVIYFNAGNAAKAGGDPGQARASWEEAARHPTDRALAEKIDAALASPK